MLYGAAKKKKNLHNDSCFLSQFKSRVQFLGVLWRGFSPKNPDFLVKPEKLNAWETISCCHTLQADRCPSLTHI